MDTPSFVSARVLNVDSLQKRVTRFFSACLCCDVERCCVEAGRGGGDGFMDAEAKCL